MAADHADENVRDDSSAERQTIARLTEAVVPALIDRLAKSELGELEVRENGWRVRLRRPSGDAAGASAAAARSHAAGRRHEARQHAGSAAGAQTEAVPREQPRGVVASPGVGYFAPRDGIAVGSAVRSGDLLGHVDVLGVRQEVVAPIDGVLRSLDVEPGQAVEYGQPIGRVEAVRQA